MKSIFENQNQKGGYVDQNHHACLRVDQLSIVKAEAVAFVANVDAVRLELEVLPGPTPSQVLQAEVETEQSVGHRLIDVVDESAEVDDHHQVDDHHHRYQKQSAGIDEGQHLDAAEEDHAGDDHLVEHHQEAEVEAPIVPLVFLHFPYEVNIGLGKVVVLSIIDYLAMLIQLA